MGKRLLIAWFGLVAMGDTYGKLSSLISFVDVIVYKSHLCGVLCGRLHNTE